MSTIFISHAVVDKSLAKLFTDFLKEAIGVPSEEIFCSSVPGHGIPLTVDFNQYMKDKIQNPKLVILIMTPSYMESAFCLMELGAAWAKSHRTLPIVVPPVPFEKVTKTLGLVQAWNIEDHTGLVELRAAVRKTGITLEKRSEQDWDRKRTEWRQKSKKVIAKLQGPSSVAAAEHEALRAENEAAKATIVDLERQLDTASDTIEKLKEAKDSVEVRAIMRQASGGDALEEEFESLLSKVQAALPEASNAVRKHIIMDHYGKAPRIDWFYNRPDFEDAIQRNLVNNDDGNTINWNGQKLSKLRKALSALDKFMDSDDGSSFAATRDEDTPIEADDLDFWRYHLDL